MTGFPIESDEIVRCVECGDHVVDRPRQRIKHGLENHDTAFVDYEEP